MSQMIYKIFRAAEWEGARKNGLFTGSSDDLRDGFIHFSTASQVRATFEKYFSREDHLKIASVQGDALGDALKWETSRRGAVFPHLYGTLPLTAVRWVKPLRLDDDGRHVLPPLE